MKQVYLTQGKIALVDDSDYEKVVCYKWYATLIHNTWYARRNVTKKCKYAFLHSFILEQDSYNGYEIDHINGNGLNNIRSNLRLCTHKQNTHNSPSRGGTSQYKGVSWAKKKHKWAADITPNGIHKFLGYFDDEVTAALAYNKAAMLYFKEFAYLNNVNDNE